MITKSLFISQPMSGLTEEEILRNRQEAIKFIQDKYPEYNIVAIDSFKPAPDQGEKNFNQKTAVAMLGEALTKLALADIVYFIPGWKKSKGCQIENEVARRWLEDTGVIIIEDGMEEINVEVDEEDLIALKNAADEAGLSLHKYVGLKLQDALQNGVADKIIEGYKNAKNNSQE